MRRPVTFVPTFAARPPALFLAQRRGLVYSEQHPVLLNNAAARGFASNLWVELKEDRWWSGVAKLRDGERPTEVPGDVMLQLHNAAQLASPLQLPEPAAHSSLKTRKPYAPFFQGLIERAVADDTRGRSLTSKWWLPHKDRGYGRTNNEKPIGITFRKPLRLCNADQFDDPAALVATPISGGTKVPYQGDVRARLRTQLRAVGCTSGLVFTRLQLERLGLAARTDAAELHVPIGVSGYVPPALYNVADVDGGAALLEDLQRYPVDVPTDVLSGRPIRAAYSEALEEWKRARDEDGSGAHGNYWVSETWLRRRGLTPTSAAVPLKVTAPSAPATSMQVTAYCVEHLQDPAEAFKKAGTDAAV